VPVDIVSNYTRETTNPDTRRDTLRLFIKAAANNGPDNALVRVARGEFGDVVTLDYATTRAENNARFERAHQAIRRDVAKATKSTALIGIS